MIKLSEKLHFGKHLRLLYFKRFLQKNNLAIPLTILDAGCGDGTFSLYLSKKNPEATITALDMDQSKIENLQHINKNNINFISFDLNNLSSLPHKYDWIIMLDVLEHIRDDMSLLKACFTLLNNKGVFILHVPFKDFDPEGKFGLRKFRRKKQAHSEHVRDGYSKSELYEIFSLTGFKNIEMQFTAGPISMFAHTIFEFYRGHNYLLYFLLHPVMMFLAYLEILIYPGHLKYGGGIILFAKKT